MNHTYLSTGRMLLIVLGLVLGLMLAACGGTLPNAYEQDTPG
jgi:hypothetical protein